MVKSDEGRKKERQTFSTNLGKTIFQLNYTIDGKILQTFDLFKNMTLLKRFQDFGIGILYLRK